MECHEGATMIKTFRGLIADGVQDTIVLHTNDGSTGYRIVKFNIISNTPGASADESTVSIWKVKQASVSAAANDIDFSDNTLLGVGYWAGASSSGSPFNQVVIFDSEIFNQDIYITHNNVAAGTAIPCNYYLELEQMTLDLSENTVATLKDIRNVTTPT